MSSGATSTRTGESAAMEEKSRLYNDHYVDSTEEETVLMFDLPSGKKWKKRIWPRKAYPKKLFRWNTAEEILSYLISFDHHDQWISSEVPHRPPSGTILFFDKTKRKMEKKTKARPSRESSSTGTLAGAGHLQARLKDYRIDGYDWKTRRGSGYIREDRMKLKVSGFQLLYGCYTHCASNPNFHKRSYWLLQNPNLVMVHYLEVDPEPSMVEEEEQDPAEVASSIVPANWDLLTISDCNLCALLNMVNKADEIQGLMKQLTQVLGQNVQTAQDFERAIEMNNTGLPFDKFEESRSKKQRCRVFIPKKENPVVPTSSSSEDSSISMSASSEGSSEVPKMVSLNVPESKEQSMNQAAVSKVLSTTPHIILCFPKNSGMSYVFFNSALKMPVEAKSSGKKKPQGPSSKKSKSNESRSLNTNGKVGGVESSSLASAQTPEGTESPKAHQGKGMRKGKEKASVPETRQDFPFFIPVLRNLSNPAQSQPNSTTNLPFPAELAASSAQFPLLRSHDYDPESFSKFASSLVSMDLEGLEGGVTGKVSEFAQTEEPGPSGCNSLTSLALSAEERAFLSEQSWSGGGMHDLEASDEDFQSDSEEMELSYPNEDQEMPQVSCTPAAPVSWLLQPTSGEEPASQSMHSPVENGLSDAASSSMVHESHLAVENGYGRENGNKRMSNESRDQISTQSCDHHVGEVPLDISLELSPNSLNHLLRFSSSPLMSRQNQEAEMDEPSHSLSPLSRLIESMTPTAIDETTHMLQANSSAKAITSALRSAETESNSNTKHGSTSGLQTYPVSTNHTANELRGFIPPTHTSMSIPYSQASVSHSQSSMSHSQSSTSHSQPSVSHSQSSISHSQTTSAPDQGSFGPQWLEVGSSVPEVVVTSPSDSVWNWQYCNSVSMPLWADSSLMAGGHGDVSTSKHAQQEQTHSTGPLSSDALEIELPKEIADLVLYPELQSMESPFHSNIPTQFHSQTIPSPRSIPTPDTRESDSLLENSGVYFTIAPPDLSTSATAGPRVAESSRREPERFRSSSLGGPISHIHSDSDLQQWDAPSSSGFRPHLEHTPTRSYSDAMLHNWNPSHTSPQNHPLSSSLGQLDAQTSQASSTGSLNAHSLFHSLQLPHLSLNLDRASPIDQAGFPTSSNRRSSRPQSLSPLEDITEGVQMELPVLAQLRRENLGEGEMNLFHDYRTSSPVPSSPSVASVSSQSTISLFDAGDSPTVLELCELLSESPNVHESDFSHMPLSDDEQKQLFRAAHIIQNAFRKYKYRRQMRVREKQAALLIENYYKRYREVKQQKEFAARRIQHQYRVYKSRIRELNRAAVFIQQMYRFHKARRDVHEANRHMYTRRSQSN